MMPPSARELALPVIPVPPDVCCADIFERFLAEPETLHIPVVIDRRPVGLISRQNFLLTYGRIYSAELYGRSSITRLMEHDMLLVDGGTSCENIHKPAQDSERRLRPFVVTENGLYAGVGEAAELMLVIADLATARAAALKEETVRAEAASRSKTQFLASMSHELRTPLNAIIGFTDLMRLKTFGELQPSRYGEYVEDIYRSGVHLLHMINELLDMGKIESGHVELCETVFHPADVGLEVLHMLRQSLAEAGLNLRIDVAKNLPPICADQQQVRRILINLLSNSIKYTPAGGTITLSVCICSDTSDCGVEGMKVTVADTGIGIPEHKLEKVLEPFEQVENSFTKTRAGTGLGLSLTKAMLEAHGGRLWLESELGHGTRAHALLPTSRIVWNEMIGTGTLQRGASPV
ncbi:MAG: hypothetical protein K9G30_01015 [Parvibaculum sp.]|nr:hypothetical protein [Parvibaculum sp.]